MQALITPLDYAADPHWLGQAMAQPWSIWLDSGGCDRYDIFVTEPAVTVTTRGTETQIESSHGVRTSNEDPLLILREELARAGSAHGDIALPFGGGAVGYFGYDLLRAAHGLAPHSHSDPAPVMMVGIYNNAIVVDHEQRRAYYVGPPEQLSQWNQWMHGAPRSDEPRLRATSEISSSFTRESYARNFARIQDYLRAGDCYQVNLAQRFQARCTGDPWSAYRALRALSPAPFGAYMNLPGLQVLSNSPERFLQVRDRQVVTRPIKGTRPRSDDPDLDALLAAELSSSAKDRAENLMIVDLLRNDLSKTCADVTVPELFKLESYATVHHLVSTVTGRLRANNDSIDLLRGCLPGGSVTGAPKRRAMEIIDELEPVGRGIYCGAIGYIGFDGDMDINIAIRTLVHENNSLRFWAGGGIVADSQCEAEYQECLTKASALARTITPGSESNFI